MNFVDVDLEVAMDAIQILSGAYSPLSGFMNQSDYNSVLENMRLSNGNIFPIPITLPVDKGEAEIDSEIERF